MKRFYIYRHGRHDANQPVDAGPVHVATVTAHDRRQALALARKHVACHDHQFLSTMPADPVIAGPSETTQHVILVEEPLLSAEQPSQ
jgi:hypothetical protein